MNPNENFIFSPFSLYSSLGMLYLMSNGRTSTQMSQVLHMSPDINKLGLGYADISKYIKVCGTSIHLYEI